MRRGLAFVLVAVLLLAVPLAAADKGSKLPTLPERLPLQPAPGVPQGRAVASSSPPGGGAGDWVALLGLGAASAGMLALGLRAAKSARLARAKRPPKRTREGGRQRARELAPRTMDAAFLALNEAHLGALLEAVPIPGGARVMVERPRGHPCEEVQGFLAGLFESAWAMDVRVEHAQCAGRSGPCRYVVSRADAKALVEPHPARVSASGARTEGASTPGLPAAARRSPRAPRGAG